MRIIIYCLICLAAVITAGCISYETEDRETTTYNSAEQTQSNPQLSWIHTPLVDLMNGKTITIQQFLLTNKPLIIHTFAVWCPRCSSQLVQTTSLMYDFPDAYTVFAIDIDPREDAELIQNHIRTNGIQGTIIRAPASFSREIIKNFGDGISLTLPQTIIICNGTIIPLGDQVFTKTQLHEKIQDLCAPPEEEKLSK